MGMSRAGFPDSGLSGRMFGDEAVGFFGASGLGVLDCGNLELGV